MLRKYLFGVVLISTMLGYAQAEESQIFKMKQSIFPLENGSAGTDSEEIILTPPSGEEVYYENTADGWYISIMGIGSSETVVRTKITWCDNGDVYISNPISHYSTDAYIKGHLDGDDIVVELPQCVGTYLNDKQEVCKLYVNKMEFYSDDALNHNSEGWFYIVDPEENYVKYHLNPDESITMDLEQYQVVENHIAPFILGLTVNNEPQEYSAWTGYGDFKAHMVPTTEFILTIPEDLTPEKWNFSYSNSHGNGAHKVDIAFSENQIYIAGLYKGNSQACVKGCIEGDKVIIPSPQYIGDYKPMNWLLYFHAATIVDDPNSDVEGDGILTLTENLILDFDRESKVMSAPNNQIILITPKKNSAEISLDSYSNPVFTYQDPDLSNARPLAPSLYDNFEYIPGDYLLMIDIPKTNENGALLDTSRMYYLVYVNNEIFTFTPEVYHKLSESMTEIPYNFSDGWDIFVTNTIHSIHYYDGSYTDFDCQSFYVAEDGQTYASDLVMFNQSAVTGIEQDNFLSESYYNLQGVKVENPKAGLYLVKRVSEDGKISYVKKIIR